MTDYLKLIDEVADTLKDTAAEGDALGRLPESTIAAIRHTRIVRAFQSKEYGGDEAHPADFAEAAMKLASLNASAGWCGGVIGVHSWQMAGFDKKLRDELWGDDPETWASSPYAPLGVLEPVEGGYRVSGRIPFSSGGEASEWAIVGALMKMPEGGMELRHIVLPREDYWFDQDSWDVLGLRGTGSKDLVCDGAVVPEYRLYHPRDFEDGIIFEREGLDNPLYKLPFPVVFSFAINCASQGIAEGAMNALLENAKGRVDAKGTRSLDDPYQMTVLSEAAADVRAGHQVLIDVAHKMYDQVAANGKLTHAERIEFRANGVRAIRRSVEAVERAFNYAGGRALQNSSPVNRGLRDAKTTLAHICNNQHPVYQVWAKVNLGLDYSLDDYFF